MRKLGTLSKSITVFSILTGQLFAADLDQILYRKKLYLGVATVYKDPNPLTFKNIEKQTYTGLEIRLAQFIAKKLGVQLWIVPTKWDGLGQALKYDNIDVGIQQIFIPENDASSNFDQVLFSEPYLESSLGILCRQAKKCNHGDIFKNLDRMASYNDIFNINWLKKRSSGNVKTFDQEKFLFDAYNKQKIDYILYDLPLLKAFLKNNRLTLSPNQLIELKDARYSYGTMVSKNSVKLLKKINELIPEWKKIERL